jgi:membrane-bound lytic murein transglycosylase D
LKRAQEELGTSDIAVIVKRFNGATFGFASRNFYVSFLAALEVDRNADKFFGTITRLPDTESSTVDLPDYIRVEALARAFKVDIGALKVLNPALRPPVWSGSRFVPRGYALRLPGNLPKTEIEAAWQRLPGTERYVAQRNDGSHRVRRNETLAGIAVASGVSMARLLAVNGWSAGHAATRGDVVRIPLPASRTEASGAPALAAAAQPAEAVPVPPTKESIAKAPPTKEAAAKVATSKEPVAQSEADSNALLPVASPTGISDTTDYGVRAGNVVIVQADETLGHYADWTGVSSQSLRALNKLHKNAVVTLGHKVKLDLSRVSGEEFAQKRRAYHQRLQEEFFDAHRIAGTETYTIKRGDSVWVIAQQHDLPVWLVAQYNPDVDFAEIRPGTTIALPRAAAINRE